MHLTAYVGDGDGHGGVDDRGGGGGDGDSTSQLLPKQKLVVDQMICSLVGMEVTANIALVDRTRVR